MSAPMEQCDLAGCDNEVPFVDVVTCASSSDCSDAFCSDGCELEHACDDHPEQDR